MSKQPEEGGGARVGMGGPAEPNSGVRFPPSTQRYKRNLLTTEWNLVEIEKLVLQKFNDMWWQRGNFTWGTIKYRGLTCWQTPCDLWLLQEIIEERKPGVIIELGTAHGGTTIWLSDVLARVNPNGIVLTVDTIRRETVSDMLTGKEGSPNPKNVMFFNCSSLDPMFLAHATLQSGMHSNNVLVFVDSDHSEENVLKELETFSMLVGDGGYIVCHDTMLSSVRGAIVKFLSNHSNNWWQDLYWDRLMLSFCLGGFLKRHDNGPPSRTVPCDLCIMVADPEGKEEKDNAV